MLQGLRTVVYYAGDLAAAREWYNKVFGITPYFDELYYVGYHIGGSEPGLNLDDTGFSNGNHSITYGALTI